MNREIPAETAVPREMFILRCPLRRIEFFDRRGNDIYCEIPISFTDAALGCEMTVPTLDGKIKYNVPEGTQTDSTFRFKGKGVPKLGSKSRGDMYVTVTVEIPKNLTGKQKRAAAEICRDGYG